MTGQCTITPGCGFGEHLAAAHPCGQPIHVGDPCSYCAAPIAADATGAPAPCPRCWTPMPGNLADIKALLATVDLSL